MSRTIYRHLLQLHPGPFRRQFADEMLWIFDETAAFNGPVPLVADGMLSLLRQWLLRNSTLKIAAAVVGGLIHVSLGLLLAACAMK